MSDKGTDTLLAGSMVAIGAASTSFWGASHLAALVAGNDFDGRWPYAPVALVRLVANENDPEYAWKADPGTFGSTGLFWVIAAVVLLGTIGALLGLWMWWTKFNVGLDRSERLGMVPEARMGHKNELGPIKINKPVHGRFTLGRVMGHLVATEDPATQSARNIRNRAKTRVGDRTSVMIFGASRSGKTATIVPGIIEWDLPAVISSVKDDLMKDTLARRLDIGEVFLFDPFKMVSPLPHGVTRVSWSPVTCSTTIDGAKDAAQTLADAAGTDDLTTGGFWSDRGATLLTPLLFAAATDNRSMSDVVRWLANQDGIDEGTSEVRTILNSTIAAGGPLGMQAAIASENFEGWVKLDPRPRSDQNSTAQSLVSCWNSLQAAASSDPSLPPINIGTILSGRNTLYIVQPLGRGDQFAAMFGGLFGDLIRDQTYRIHTAAGERIGPLLAVLDEAFNTPLRWLPQVASTCAGIGVQLVTIWQDKSQVSALYKEEAQSLLNNHATKVFFAGQSDQATLEYASLLCGEEEVTSTSASADLNMASGRRSASAQVVTKRLVPTDMIRLIPNGTALLIHNTLRPFHLVGRRLSEEPKLQRLTTTRPELAAANGDPLANASMNVTPTKPAPSLPPLMVSPNMTQAFKAAHISLDEDVIAHMARGRRPDPTAILDQIERRQPLSYD